MTKALHFSGQIADRFFRSRLTPLLALVGLLMGIFAALITPREEEPQIDVTMADVMIVFPGAAVADVEKLVTVPMEEVLAEIDDVDHVFSTSRPGMAIITVQFEVGHSTYRSVGQVIQRDLFKSGLATRGPGHWPGTGKTQEY